MSKEYTGLTGLLRAYDDYVLMTAMTKDVTFAGFMQYLKGKVYND